MSDEDRPSFRASRLRPRAGLASVAVFCPHEPHEQKVMSFHHENLCPDWCLGGHAVDDDHRSEPDQHGRAYFERATPPESAWGATAILRGNRKREHGASGDGPPVSYGLLRQAMQDKTPGALGDDDKRAGRRSHELQVRPDGSVDDDISSVWNDSHRKYRLHCDVCGIDLQVRHERLVPELERLRKAGVSRVPLPALARVLS